MVLIKKDLMLMVNDFMVRMKDTILRIVLTMNDTMRMKNTIDIENDFKYGRYNVEGEGYVVENERYDL